VLKLLPWPGNHENRNKIQLIKSFRSVTNLSLKDSKDIVDELWAGRSVEINADDTMRPPLELSGFITDYSTVAQRFHDLLTCVVNNRKYRLAHALLLSWIGEERRQKPPGEARQ
jgi:hypothetical protein